MKIQEKLNVWAKELTRLRHVRIGQEVYSERELIKEAEGAIRAAEPMRCWINQPSSSQPLHRYHGTNGIWANGYFWFMEGEVSSMRCPKLCISEGWR